MPNKHVKKAPQIMILCLLLLTSCQKQPEAEKVDYASFCHPFTTEKEIPLYENGSPAGTIASGVSVTPLCSDIADGYFSIRELPYQIYYEDVSELEATNSDQPLYPYIPFDAYAITKADATLYDTNGIPQYTLHDSFEAQIWIKGEQFYTVEYYERFYQLAIDQIEQFKATTAPPPENLASDVPVLMYHFFYSKANGEKPSDNNWLEVGQFEEQLAYLKDNGYVTLHMIDLERFLKGEVQLDDKTLVITIDDGDPTVYKYAYPLLQQYDMIATTFLVTSWYWWDIDNRIDPHIELQSHSNDMHQGGCTGQHGGLILCIDTAKGVEDLKQSTAYTYGAWVFAYPFGDFNDHAKEILRLADFRLAFTTVYGTVKPGMDLLELPRVRISNEDSLSAFANKIK